MTTLNHYDTVSTEISWPEPARLDSAYESRHDGVHDEDDRNTRIDSSIELRIYYAFQSRFNQEYLRQQ